MPTLAARRYQLLMSYGGAANKPNMNGAKRCAAGGRPSNDLLEPGLLPEQVQIRTEHELDAPAGIDESGACDEVTA